MRAITIILENSKPHVENLLSKHFYKLKFLIGKCAYKNKISLEIEGDVQLVNEFFRLYYMYAEYLKRKENFLKKVGKNKNKS